LIKLNGQAVQRIYSDLSPLVDGKHLDLTTAARLVSNAGVSFQGVTKAGSLDITGDLARIWLQLPRNPNGRPNSDVLRPYYNAESLVQRPSDTWVIDFGCDLDEDHAAFYEAPFQYAESVVKPERLKNRRKMYRERWWRFAEARPGMRKQLAKCSRYIATPLVSKHRIFVWLSVPISPANLIVVIARDDDTTFGILHSRFHRAWSLRKGTSLEDRPRYTPSSTFETFPFPPGLEPNIPATQYAADARALAVSAAARVLNDLRERWLNPPDLIRVIPEVVRALPDRIVPVDENAATQLKRRTLTNLYNQNPSWLVKAHKDLDEAVANAYGWSNDMSEDEVLARLLQLNLERSVEHRIEEQIPRKGPSVEEDIPARKITIKRTATH
jgi:type II restriction/modification system DNA methylase subunit YeeA